MYSVDVMQNIIWVGACGVVNGEYISYIYGVKGQDPGVDEMFDNGFLWNTSAIVPGNGEPMPTPISCWYIWPQNEK
jgi:hypothetical protein